MGFLKKAFKAVVNPKSLLAGPIGTASAYQSIAKKEALKKQEQQQAIQQYSSLKDVIDIGEEKEMDISKRKQKTLGISSLMGSAGSDTLG